MQLDIVAYWVKAVDRKKYKLIFINTIFDVRRCIYRVLNALTIRKYVSSNPKLIHQNLIHELFNYVV